ncbi:hypothetical protein Aph01nite_53950 [Acrocarpospora phusangensis]|uniref:Novel STAND NTPase 1 domain-containing protein n=1 Tax=Acrocarpospora phusangensis TaxID=1070424 RepID=A0A919QIP9_9ACTN|nr:tetratricopeptide repeat protein [Acrocarpospora phusangensis]GIH27085.1 hypothetical protein Aph01nite_53950 [Acrocarpospora phusangensis]
MDNPYVGLQSFDADHAEQFFGRSRESSELADLWCSNQLVILYGPSGIGKTSLLHAGALPRLRRDHIDLLPVGRAVPAAVLPAPTMATHNPFTFSLLSSWSPADSPVRLAGKTVSDFLLDRPAKKHRDGEDLPLFAAIDQFEEVLVATSVWRKQADDFLTELGRATKDVPHLRLVISIREDAVAALLPYESLLAGHARARMRLLALRPDDAVAAVVGPSRSTPRSYEEDAAENLVRDLRTVRTRNTLGKMTAVETDQVEPWQLQVACAALWDRLPADRTVITKEDVRDFGDVSLALMDVYEQAIAALTAEFGLSEGVLRKWLEESFITDLGTRAQTYEGRDQTRGLPNGVARAFERRHILRSERRSGARWYELQHDRLIEPIQLANRPWTGSGTVRDTVEPRASDYQRSAEAALAEGDFTSAARYATQCVRTAERGTDEPSLRTAAEANSLLGDITFLQGRPDEAERRYRDALRQFAAVSAWSAVARLQQAIGRIHLGRRLPDQALEQFQGALHHLPNDHSIRIDLGRASWHSGRLVAALSLFNSVLVASPDNEHALADRTEILADLGDYVAALEDFARLSRMYPDRASSPEIQAAAGLALAGLGRGDEAENHLDGALVDAPDSGPVLLRVAKAAALMGKIRRAKALAQTALDSSNPPLFAHHFDQATDMLRAFD